MITVNNTTNESMSIVKVVITPLIRGVIKLTYPESAFICGGGAFFKVTTNLKSGSNPNAGYLEEIGFSIVFSSQE